MLDLPFSKLKIKIHALDNPTSVFKKRNLLSLNCINKPSPKKKSITPLRTYTNDLPHYMMPKKSQLNQNIKNTDNNNVINNNNLQMKSSSFINKKNKIIKNNENDSKINYPKLYRGKSDNLLQKSNIFKNGRKNNINSSLKKNNHLPNINVNQNKSLNDEYNIVKNGLNGSNYPNFYNLNEINNNDILYTEQNNNVSNINIYSPDSNIEKNIPNQFQMIISEMQKKINEQNKLLSERTKEIEFLKKHINNDNEIKNNEIVNNNNLFDDIENINNLNEIKNENELLIKENERFKSILNDYRQNNQEKTKENEKNNEKIKKLKQELDILKEEINMLKEKYDTELKNNKILEQQYKYIKNNIKNPQELTKKYVSKINELLNDNENLLNIIKKKKIYKKCKILNFEIIGNLNNGKDNKEKIQIARTLTREFIVKIEVVDGKMSSNNTYNNNYDEPNENIIIQDTPSKKYILSSKNSNSSIIFNQNEKLILPEKQYNNIQLLLNILLNLNGINEEKLNDKIKQFKNKRNEKKENKIEENQINLLINEFCHNLKISNIDLMKQFINDFMIKDKKGENVLKKLFKYNKTNLNFNLEIKRNIFKKCKIYDYRNKKTIPFSYFKHLYKEICYNQNNLFSEKEFFNIIYECKEQKNNNIYSLFDIFYENLILEESQNNNNNVNKLKEENIEKNNKVDKKKIKEKFENKIEINNNENEKNKQIDKENEIKITNNKFIKSYKLKYKDLIQNFLDKIIKEAIEKQKDDDDGLVKARSFDQDLFSKLTLQNENNNSKLNELSSDEEENNFDI